MPRTNYELVSWSALVISILAIIISWNTAATTNQLAQNSNISISAEASPSSSIQSSTRPSMKTNNIWLETKERLNQINEEIAKTADPDQAMISQQISQLRIDLKNKYQELDDDSKLDWETNDQDLADLEKDFKAGTVNAINNLQMLLEKLEQKISPSNN